LGGELQIRLFQRRKGILHGEEVFHFLVIDDERHNLLTFSPGAVRDHLHPKVPVEPILANSNTH
jgi:hypothetical protein